MSNTALLTDWCCRQCRRKKKNGSSINEEEEQLRRSEGGGFGGGDEDKVKLFYCRKHCTCVKYCSVACEQEDRRHHEGSCRRMRECMKELFASLPPHNVEALVAPQRPVATAAAAAANATTATARRNSMVAAARRGRGIVQRGPLQSQERDGGTSDQSDGFDNESMESNAPTDLKRVLTRTLWLMQKAESTLSSEVQHEQAQYEAQLDEYLWRQMQNHPEEVESGGMDATSATTTTTTTMDNFILDDVMNVEMSPRAAAIHNANHNAAQLRICKSRVRLAEALETVASLDFYDYEVSPLLERALACRLDALGRNAGYAKDCHHVLPFLLLRLNRDHDCFTFLRHCVVRDAVLRANQPTNANNNNNNNNDNDNDENNNNNNNNQHQPIDRVAAFHNFAVGLHDDDNNNNNNNNNNFLDVLLIDGNDHHADDDVPAPPADAPAENDNVTAIHFPAFEARVDTHCGLLDQVPLEPQVSLSDVHVSFLLAAVLVKYRLVATCWSRVHVFYSCFAETPLAKLLDRDSLSVVLSFVAGTANVNRYVRRQEAFVTAYLTEIHKRNPSVLPAILLPAPLLSQNRPKTLLRNAKTEAWDVVQRSIHLIYQIPGLKERIADFVGSYNPTYDYKISGV